MISILPRHIAFIMDGNGRWARERGLARTSGHREGIKRVKELVKKSVELGIEFVTFFAFSSENWKRPKYEVNMIMRSLVMFLNKEVKELHKKNIRFKTIGRKDDLPAFVIKKLEASQRLTSGNDGMTVILAFNYGSRQEIIDAALRLASLVSTNKIDKNKITEDDFSSLLYTSGIPDPDLLIRTSGEMRLSNFLLWQLSYAELYFPSKYWPDFTVQDLEKAIKIYQERERRFGDIDVSKKTN